MARRLVRISVANGVGALLLMMLAGGFSPSTAFAQVSINVNIGPPPPIVVQAPPPMLFLPEPGVYVAAGTRYDLFFLDGRYYYYHGDNWFWAAGYGGPWVHVVSKSLPPGLRRYQVVQLREFREREYHVYKVQGSNFKGKHFYAVSGEKKAAPGEKKHDEDGDDGGRGHGRGNGKK